MALFSSCLALGLAVFMPAPERGAQQFAELGNYTLQSGQTLENCRLGYRTFGSLNSTKSNAVLVCTWFLGTSGDWVGNIGPRRMLDDSKYYVIVVDVLGDGESTRSRPALP
ncbi:MAG: hypothetical protein ACYC96_15300 [Fimbriimonadaceae bacterium]